MRAEPICKQICRIQPRNLTIHPTADVRSVYQRVRREGRQAMGIDYIISPLYDPDFDVVWLLWIGHRTSDYATMMHWCVLISCKLFRGCSVLRTAVCRPNMLSGINGTMGRDTSTPGSFKHAAVTSQRADAKPVTQSMATCDRLSSSSTLMNCSRTGRCPCILPPIQSHVYMFPKRQIYRAPFSIIGSSRFCSSIGSNRFLCPSISEQLNHGEHVSGKPYICPRSSRCLSQLYRCWLKLHVSQPASVTHACINETIV